MYRFLVFGFILFFVAIQTVLAMDSTNYQINWDSVNSGGTDYSASTNYQLNDTMGDVGTGYGNSTNYRLHAGYRQNQIMEPAELSFNMGAPENSTKVAYTALSLTGKTVTVSSATGYSVDDYIGVVEDEGLNQKFIVGKITNISSNTFTVDKWSGTTNTISTSPAGGDDFVYRLNGHTIDFGILSPTVGKTGLVYTDVNTNASNGYVLTVQSDGYLLNGSQHIMDVSDGAVSSGSEEYGAMVEGDSATSTGSDFAITTTAREIQKSDASADTERIGMTYKIDIKSITPAGNYTQTVTYLLTASF